MSEEIPVDIHLVTYTMQEGAREQTADDHIRGGLTYKGDTCYVRYAETIEDTGLVRNTVKIGPEEATIIRNGAVSMHQRFRLQRCTEGEYGTSFGNLHMETTTKQLAYDYDDAGRLRGLHITYQLTLQGNDVGDVDMMFHMEEVAKA